MRGVLGAEHEGDILAEPADVAELGGEGVVDLLGLADEAIGDVVLGEVLTEASDGTGAFGEEDEVGLGGVSVGDEDPVVRGLLVADRADLSAEAVLNSDGTIGHLASELLDLGTTSGSGNRAVAGSLRW